MSRSINAVVEYTTKLSPGIIWGFEMRPGVSFSDVFAALAKSRQRGWPMTPDGKYFAGMSIEAEQLFTFLVVNDMTDDECEPYCVTQAKAREWMARGISRPLPEKSSWADIGGGGTSSDKYWRITHPDLSHGLNWITADELEKVIERAGRGMLHGYRAALAAMRSLEADENIASVRYVYAFDQD